MRQELNGLWECSYSDGRRMEVMVPGCFDTYVREKDIADTVELKRSFLIEELKEENYRLRFGAVSYYCEIYLNGEKIAEHEGMWDNFYADVNQALKKGENEILLKVIKPGYKDSDRFPLRTVLSGFIPDVLCTFGGIWDDVWLESEPGFFVDSHSGDGTMDGDVYLEGVISGEIQGEGLSLSGKILDAKGNVKGSIASQEIRKGSFLVKSHVENPILWEQQSPYLYTYELFITDGIHTKKISKKFGFRTITTNGSMLLLNGRPIYARGVLHWGYYDEITPKISREQIEDEITKVKDYGFNMIKQCLYIPREEYFALADEMGMLLWIELPLWLPDKTEWLSERIRREFSKLIPQIAGHPSIALASLGCELDDKVESDVLEEMYVLAKGKLRVPIRDNSGSGECYDGLSVDYADFSDYHFYGDLQNMEPLMENFTPAWKTKRPWMYGEFCDSDTLRDLEPLRKEKGVETFLWEKQEESENPICILKSDFFLGEHDKRMEESGIREEYSYLKELSYNHTMVHRKTTIEQTRAFSEITGYNITAIRDVPIATSGIFDDFMKEKFDKEVFRSFNQDVMLLPAWDLTRVWINADRVMSKERYGFFGGEYYGLHVLLSNYGGMEISSGTLRYELLSSDGESLVEKEQKIEAVAHGAVEEVCYISMTLPQVKQPSNLILKVTLTSGDIRVQNQWPVFLYPKQEGIDGKIALFDPLHIFTTVEKIYENIEVISQKSDLRGYNVILCSYFSEEIRTYVKEGGKVFYVQRGGGELESIPVAFYREGMVRCYEHPILEGLSYDNWMDDLRFFGSATDTAFLHTKGSEDIVQKPIIRRYDCREWRADDYMMELSLGKGIIIATTLRLEGGMGKQPAFLENNRFGRWLLHQSLNYLLGQ